MEDSGLSLSTPGSMIISLLALWLAKDVQSVIYLLIIIILGSGCHSHFTDEEAKVQ